MKILFITDNFPPEVNAPATRTYEHCMEWIRLGAEITVITGAPNFPVGKVYSGYKNSLYKKENMNGINVIRVWTYISSNKGFIKRIMDYISFSFTAFFAGLFVKKPDIIVATSPQFFSALCGFKLSQFRRKPWIMEVRDLWPESIKTVGAMKDGWAIRYFERKELKLYRKATKIITVTDSFKKRISEQGIDHTKIEVIKNGSNVELFNPREKNVEILQKLSLENKFVIGYIGTHGMAHKLDFILNAIPDIQDNEIHFLFIGDGAEKKSLLELSEKLKLKNVTFLDPIQKENIPDYLSIVDVSLVPLKKSDTFKTVIPSKIFESAAMQKPILLGVEGESKGIIEKYQAGICFEPENKKDFIQKLQILKTEPTVYQRCKEGCTELAKAFNRKDLAARMYRIINSTLK